VPLNNCACDQETFEPNRHTADNSITYFPREDPLIAWQRTWGWYCTRSKQIRTLHIKMVLITL